MSRGILLLAWGKRGYGFMAYNLAVSLKHHSPGIPIHLIATESVLKEVNDKLVFDSIEWLDDAPLDPGRFKAQIYYRLPFDETLFLDVDGLCLQPIEPMLDRLSASGVHYATFINEVYDINSPNILPQMWWAYRQDIWSHYGFDHETKFPATQSSIQYIRKCDKTAQLYELFNEAFENPIPLEQLRNRWGGGQPDELYLNVALAKQGEFHHIGLDSMYFGNTSAIRPHVMAKDYYFLSLFGNRSNIKPMYWDYYDNMLGKIQSQRGMRHIFKGHSVRSDKIANISSPKTIVKPPVYYRPDSVKLDKQPGTVILFTSYFEQKHSDRQRELKQVMQRNIDCQSIDKIVNLGTAWEHDKVINLPYDRPTFADFIKEMQNHEADYYILANSDIYFTSEIERIKELKMDGKVLALSRWDIMANGSAKLFDYEWTQDTWIWKGKPKQMANLDFIMGVPACDNRLAYEIAQNGMTPINPSKDIKTYHLHISNKRTYTERNRLPGQVLPVVPMDSSRWRQKTCVINQPGKVGDIICVLPIAKWWADKGYKVFWQCPKQYHSLFDYIYYCIPIEKYEHQADKVIDLSFGLDTFSPIHRKWLAYKRTGKSFVQFKYEIAEVPLSQIRNLIYKRNEQAEQNLIVDLGLDPDGDYHVYHDSSDYGTAADMDIQGPSVRFQKVKDYTIFDWRKVLEKASSIHCIDSSLSNFVDAIEVKADLHYYITDKVPSKSDRTILTKNWKHHAMARV